MKKISILTVWLLGYGCIVAAEENCTATNTVSTDDIHRYMWAEYQRLGGNNQEAYRWYKELLARDPSPHVYKGYIHFLAQAGNFSSVAQLYTTHQERFKNDEGLQLVFVQALEADNRIPESEKLLFELATTHKKNPKITLYAVQACIRNKDLDKGLQILDNYFDHAPKTPNNYVFYFLKSQIYSQKKDLPAALRCVKKSLKIYPNFDKSWLMYAALKEQMGHLQEAIKGYNTFIEKTEAPNFDIQRYLMNLVFRQKQLEQHASTLLADKTLLEQALVLFKSRQFEAALTKVTEAIAKEPTSHEAKLLKVQIYTSMHQYKDAAQTLQAFMLEEPENTVWHEALHLLCRSGLSFKTALSILTEVTTQKPEALLPHLYLADLLTRNQQIEKALEQHVQALKLTPDKSLQTRLHYNMALLYYQQKKYPQMLASVEAIEQQDPNFLPAFNLHAYYLATTGKQVAKARPLIAKVLAKDPHNPHYLDTQAVILYKEKKYTKAQNLLKQLAKEIPGDATIIKHLAKVHYKLGDKKTARSTIDQAIQYASAAEKKECESLIERWNI